LGDIEILGQPLAAVFAGSAALAGAIDAALAEAARIATSAAIVVIRPRVGALAIAEL
jgi:hypothetical protein